MPITDPFLISTRSFTRPVAEYWGEIAGIQADAAMLIVERSLRSLLENGVIVAGSGVPVPAEVAVA